MDELKTADNVESQLTPQQYFEQVKERKHNITDEELVKVYDNCLELLNKYKITGQKKGMRKLMFHLECIEKEREIVKMGINTFIYRDDIEEYIDTVARTISTRTATSFCVAPSICPATFFTNSVLFIFF